MKIQNKLNLLLQGCGVEFLKMTLDDLKRCENCKHYLPSMHGCDFCGEIREELLP